MNVQSILYALPRVESLWLAIMHSFKSNRVVSTLDGCLRDKQGKKKKIKIMMVESSCKITTNLPLCSLPNTVSWSSTMKMTSLYEVPNQIVISIPHAIAITCFKSGRSH